MTSHELAKVLLGLPDVQVATHANNHTYRNRDTHGPMRVGLLALDKIVIGNFSNHVVITTLYDEDKAEQERNKAIIREMEASGKTKNYGDVITEIAKHNPAGIDLVALIKGQYGMICNRTDCGNNQATWFNHSTRKYYCQTCAAKLNRENHDEAMRLFKHELCTNESYFDGYTEDKRHPSMAATGTEGLCELCGHKPIHPIHEKPWERL